jgi:hypothetical protein
MAEKDGWGAATQIPLKNGVAPQANKSFGKGFDDTESTNAKLSHSTAKVNGPDHPAKGSNDIAHAGTAAPLPRVKPITANRPENWPRGFQK